MMKDIREKNRTHTHFYSARDDAREFGTRKSNYIGKTSIIHANT